MRFSRADSGQKITRISLREQPGDCRLYVCSKMRPLLYLGGQVSCDRDHHEARQDLRALRRAHIVASKVRLTAVEKRFVEKRFHGRVV